MKKLLFSIVLIFIILIYASPNQIYAGEQTDIMVFATYAVDTSGTSPQYINGVDLSPLANVDDYILTSSLLGTSIDTNTPSFVFKFSNGYTPPSDEEIKSVNLQIVHRMNVGTLSQHYVIVKYINSAGQRVTCISQQNLTIPSASGSNVTDTIDVTSCRDVTGLSTVEVYYFASALLQPVNTSFDQVVLLVKHGNKSSSSSSSSSNSSTSTFKKPIDVSRNGGTLTRENGALSVLFGKNALPYEVNLNTERVFSPLVRKPNNISGPIYKLSVLSSFNGYPIPKFNPSLLFLDASSCSKRPVIMMSLDGKTWKQLFSIRTYNPSSRVAAVFGSSGYFAVSCNPR